MPEQIELLFKLVEAFRNLPKEKRQKFYVHYSSRNIQLEIIHPGFEKRHITAYEGDIESLEREGLVSLVFS